MHVEGGKRSVHPSYPPLTEVVNAIFVAYGISLERRQFVAFEWVTLFVDMRSIKQR